jgi:PAT family beta-lactamase induction signal transducer AmpG
MFKWAAGALTDRYTFMPMGRRRPWLVGSQICITLMSLAYAVVSPLPNQTSLVIGFTFALSSLTAVQDVALDALVIDLTPDGEKGRMNGFMFGGKLFGIAGGTAVTAYFIQYHGISAAMLAMMLLFAIPALAAIAIRERRGERLLPWTAGEASEAAKATKPEAWWPIFRLSLAALLRRDTLLVIALLITYGLHQTIYEQGVALFAARVLGWGESAYGNLLGAGNLIVGGLSLLVGGYLVDRYGPRTTSLVGGFTGLVLIGGYALANGLWTNDLIFIIWFIASGLFTTLFYLSFLVMAMRVSVKEVAATSYALIAATFALGTSAGGAA